jgi:hypothetical protein
MFDACLVAYNKALDDLNRLYPENWQTYRPIDKATDAQLVAFDEKINAVWFAVEAGQKQFAEFREILGEWFKIFRSALIKRFNNPLNFN